MTRALILLIAIFSMNSQAFAAPVRITQPAKSQIREKISNVMNKTFKPYTCTFEGRALDGSWFPKESTSVNVTAASLQDAAEAATTGYQVANPQPGENFIIQVEGIKYSVSVISCKPLEQSI